MRTGTTDFAGLVRSFHGRISFRKAAADKGLTTRREKGAFRQKSVRTADCACRNGPQAVHSKNRSYMARPDSSSPAAARHAPLCPLAQVSASFVGNMGRSKSGGQSHRGKNAVPRTRQTGRRCGVARPFLMQKALAAAAGGHAVLRTHHGRRALCPRKGGHGLRGRRTGQGRQGRARHRLRAVDVRGAGRDRDCGGSGRLRRGRSRRHGRRHGRTGGRAGSAGYSTPPTPG